MCQLPKFQQSENQKYLEILYKPNLSSKFEILLIHQDLLLSTFNPSLNNFSDFSPALILFRAYL